MLNAFSNYVLPWTHKNTPLLAFDFSAFRLIPNNLKCFPFNFLFKLIFYAKKKTGLESFYTTLQFSKKKWKTSTDGQYPEQSSASSYASLVSRETKDCWHRERKWALYARPSGGLRCNFTAVSFQAMAAGQCKMKWFIKRKLCNNQLKDADTTEMNSTSEYDDLKCLCH